MDTRHIHVDEISVWSWIAASAFVLIVLGMVFLGPGANVRMATPVLPLDRAGGRAARGGRGPGRVVRQ